ncbi:dimethylaniline monooxygenase [N-oxide-forming] 2 [Strongylocentrotus purpuratus]|uniref:Flavin-containing monooxygenase n=1 Tax=Strongylocentrotus purpuratus TaxID=7668 RepID=A0A7M7T4S2_STRPU|nr:dimethylaniline monooxygenase [N-oxide-forming] 2 [Strongylocentrotus purpuratus]|eukprot:XP_011660582.1 PREDICTED: dimethylaniline monooxygenase [N-oxide-forming] 2 [Strongylocentrotus purpuratus]
MTVKKVAVIGAGISGLVSTKTCLEEGFEPVCFEQTEQCGGVWVTSDKRAPGTETRGAIYDCLITNSSKEMMCFSDYPFDPSVSPYIQGNQVLNYFQGYAKHFGLEPYIRLNTKVVRVEPTEDFQNTGQWHVKSQVQSGEVDEEVFDAVMVCSGLHNKSYIPSFPGMDEFKGDIVHSCDFKNGGKFAGKTVVVVGGSHSAGDVAVDTSRHAKMTYLAMKSGTTVLPRQGPGGAPIDTYVNRRVRGLVPLALWKKWMKSVIANRLDMESLGLQSDRPLFASTSLMVNDEIGVRIWCGALKAKANIARFTETDVIFVDGTVVENVDAVIFATGYEFKFPFIDKSILQETYAELELYWHVFPPRLAHQTIALVGATNAVGAQGPMYELQARLAGRVFKGLVELPCQEMMLEDVARRKNIFKKIYGHPKVHFPPIPYCDMIAAKLGCLPRFTDLLMSDPILAYKFFFGPNYPPFYRLVGPHAWPGARNAIMKAKHNTDTPTKTRKVQSPGSDQSSTFLILLLLVIPLSIFLMTIT